MATVNQVYSSAPLVQSADSTNKYFLLRKSDNQTMFATKPYILGVVGMMMFIAVLTITDVQAKDDRCRRPVIQNCNASEFYINGWKFTGWYYHTELRMCRPLYTPNGLHTCKENYELPITRQMCDDLCAEPCTRTNGAPGICMPKDLCVITIRSLGPIPPSSCGSGMLNCCPKATDKELCTLPINNKNGLVEEGVLKKKTYGDEPDYKYYLPYPKKKECTCE
ncbi:hypothetical protein AGLY_009123 [Aphis glycines]|uniref:Uncharacterized protein n=1 Tax=Aphis glycines TaxID=307491 RepID=A0A6G0TIT1_APHGL|nr:uncharacterized protein LOC126551973 [Aphis gossypii]KAE9533485.1 hypothetical protein AGLY_009123 [Aphis glycines]